MQLFSRSSEVEIEDVRIGRIRVRVQENFIDRVIGYFAPDWKMQRLRSRAALDTLGAIAPIPQNEAQVRPLPPGRLVISAGYRPPPKIGSGPYAAPEGEFNRLVDRHQASGASRGEAIRRAVNDDPEGHKRWLESR